MKFFWNLEMAYSQATFVKKKVPQRFWVNKQQITYYYYSFKIFLCFWLAKIPRIIHHNQLLLAKFERVLWYVKNDVKSAAKLPDYWTVNQDNLGMSLSCFGSDYKMAEHFHSIHEEEIGKLLAKNVAKTARRQLNGQHLLFVMVTGLSGVQFGL